MARFNHQLFLLEAIETLSNIADLDYDQEIGIVQKHELILLRKRLSYKTVSWLHQRDSGVTVRLLREIFRTIASFLEMFYKEGYNLLNNQKCQKFDPLFDSTFLHSPILIPYLKPQIRSNV